MRILLTPPAGRDEVDAAALALGWSLANVYPRRDGRPRQVVYATGEALITFVDDHRVDARYLVLSGHDPDALADAARETLPTLSEAAVLELAATDRVRALCWLGVVGATSPAATRVIEEALESDEAPVREAARFAAEALGWEGAS
ncbi:MAG: hypothetical protein VYE22_25995 [Myxococcota bacterium]|nr:hypothetical protein [Myxococcota bacterium]